MSDALHPGDYVRIAPEKAHQFQRPSRSRKGVVIRERPGNLVAVRWEGLIGEQTFAKSLLQRLD